MALGLVAVRQGQGRGRGQGQGQVRVQVQVQVYGQAAMTPLQTGVTASQQKRKDRTVLRGLRLYTTFTEDNTYMDLILTINESEFLKKNLHDHISATYYGNSSLFKF